MRSIDRDRHASAHTRPIGLVAKLALIVASRGNPEDKLILADCYGITFLGICPDPPFHSMIYWLITS